ncbi:hypothetical protein [Vibrio hyugaensis]|nr:hypothetical protein [Vibrio hyugaensis]
MNTIYYSYYTLSAERHRNKPKPEPVKPKKPRMSSFFQTVFSVLLFV